MATKSHYPHREDLQEFYSFYYIVKCAFPESNFGVYSPLPTGQKHCSRHLKNQNFVLKDTEQRGIPISRGGYCSWS